MDSRKWGVKCLSKAGCYYILFGAIFAAVFAVISFFVKFGDINQNSLTLLFFFLSMGLFLGFYIAISQFEDPAKMILEFHPPKATHREEIQKFCEDICKHYNKKTKPLYVIAYPAALGLVCFGICSAIVPLGYLMNNIVGLFTSYFLLPALITGFFTFFIWNMIYRNRLEEIRSGAYAVAEVSFSEKYYCISGGKTSQSVRTSYFVILEDSHGNKGRFKVCESEYYKFHTDNTILLVKQTKGNLFYNAMEPVSILE